MREENPTNVLLAGDAQDSPVWSGALRHSTPLHAMRLLTKVEAAQIGTLGSGESLCRFVHA